MTPADIVVLSILAVLVIAVFVFLRRRKKWGGACAGCDRCTKADGCSGCYQAEKKPNTPPGSSK